MQTPQLVGTVWEFALCRAAPPTSSCWEKYWFSLSYLAGICPGGFHHLPQPPQGPIPTSRPCPSETPTAPAALATLRTLPPFRLLLPVHFHSRGISRLGPAGQLWLFCTFRHKLPGIAEWPRQHCPGGSPPLSTHPPTPHPTASRRTRGSGQLRRPLYSADKAGSAVRPGLGLPLLGAGCVTLGHLCPSSECCQMRLVIRIK